MGSEADEMFWSASGGKWFRFFFCCSLLPTVRSLSSNLIFLFSIVRSANAGNWCKLLLVQSAPISCTNKSNEKSLHWATQYNILSIFGLLTKSPVECSLRTRCPNIRPLIRSLSALLWWLPVCVWVGKHTVVKTGGLPVGHSHTLGYNF